MNVTLGNSTFTDDFYVVDLSDINVILGVLWLYSLGKFSMNNQVMEMEFRVLNGNKIMSRGMSNGAPRAVSTMRMEAIFRYGDIACAIDCLITRQKSSDSNQHT